jgi:hypothetical protein
LFPPEDHPDIKENTLANLSRWTVFKLYSGGSFNKKMGLHDYHLGLYDKERIQAELTSQGFIASIRRDTKHGVLRGKALKPPTGDTDYFNSMIPAEVI